jgi:class 3 adenylate cyclase/CHASE2 domain-containing sensor protein
MTKRLAALIRKFPASFKQRWLGMLIGILLPTAIGLILSGTIAGEYLTRWSYDRPFLLRGPLEAKEAVVVYLDEASHTALEQPYDRPWNRDLHARLLKRLTAEKAKGVVFDIVFSDPGPDPSVDRVFASAIKENGRVILAADAVLAGFSGTTGRKYDPPYELFYDAAEGRIGSAEYIPDGDLMIRQYLVGLPGQTISSEAWAAAQLVGANVTTNELVHDNAMYVNHYGPPGTIPGVSFYQAIADDVTLPTDFFKDKVVFVGAKTVTKYSGERKDEYATPFSSLSIRQGSDLKFTCGAEIHATAFLNLIHGQWLKRLGQGQELWIISLMGGFFGLLLVQCRPMAAVLLGTVLALAVTAANYALFTQKFTWFPWLIPVLIQIPLAVVWAVTFNSVQLYVRNQLLEQTLGKHLSPKRVKQLRANPEFLEPGAQKQRLTILFSDIENFTTISEGMDSDELAKLMNRYFETAVSDCIHKTDGFVVKYIGDAIFSFWNAPEEQKSHEVLASEAALLLRTRVVAYSKDGQTNTLRTRIGLHTGEANVGNFGSAARIDYTAIGENINLASRLEGLNKFLGTDILISSAVKQGLGDLFVTRSVGKFRLKGLERAVEIFELIGTKDQTAETESWRGIFAQALEAFANQQFNDAKLAFCEVLQLRKDGPSRFYLKYLEEIRPESLDDKWRGEVELKEK